MEDQNYLPIGTVVMLKGGTKRTMITGFFIKDQEQNKTFDYSGCLYPEGITSSKQTVMFNHNQIDKIYHLGLSDDNEEKEFKSVLNIIKQNLNSKDN